MDETRIKRLERADSSVSKTLDKLDGDEQMSVLVVACQERLLINYGKYGVGAVKLAAEHWCSEVIRGVSKFLDDHNYPSTTIH